MYIPRLKEFCPWYPCPQLMKCMPNQLAQAFMSTLDLKSGYYHIALFADSQKKIILCDSNGKVRILKGSFWTS